MKFFARAAILAAVTFGAGALANAATPALSVDPQDLQAVVDNSQTAIAVPSQDATLRFAPKAEIVQTIAEVKPEDQDFNSLTAAVAAQDAPGETSSELNCLAVGIYYEAKGEPLAGQLAVAEVILNRANSGRFPRSVCGVLTQAGQFSFIRGGKLPKPTANAHWRKALAVAQVAQKDLWESPVSEALFFHASHVKPSWKRARVGSVGNHVFYR